MAASGTAAVQEYIRAQPAQLQRALRRVRSTLRSAIPGAEDAISYKIPAIKLNGRVLLYYAGWTEHYAVYPGSKKLVTALKDELAQYEVQKGTIRFPLSEPVPVKLIERIAKLRAREAMQKARG